MLSFLFVFNVVDFLIYVSSIVAAVGVILGGMKGVTLFFGKRIKKKKEDENKKLRKTIIEDVKNALQPEFTKLHDADMEFKEIIGGIDHKINLLNASNRDLLRTDIERIYSKYKKIRKIPETDREILDKLYIDYKNEDGNGRIERMYLRTVDWEVVSDDEELFIN